MATNIKNDVLTVDDDDGDGPDGIPPNTVGYEGALSSNASLGLYEGGNDPSLAYTVI